MDVVERLRDCENYEDAWQLKQEAADEIERLREEIASCIADLDREVSEGNRYMLEAAGLREQLAAMKEEK